MAKIDELLRDQIVRVPPKSQTGRALSYLREEWQAPQSFVRDGRVPIDNICVENAIKPFPLGLKYWLFSASAADARASANLYSLIETAKPNALDPQTDLSKVFAELPNVTTSDAIEDLLPYGQER